jgi:hypothetical protein
VLDIVKYGSPMIFQPYATWSGPSPENPIELGPHQMQRFKTINKVAFEATEAAIEMEADRDAARREVHVEEKEPLAWWYDASKMSYSRPPNISRREVEGRVMRAWKTCQRVKMRVPILSKNADVIARMAKWDDNESEDDRAWRSNRLSVFDPNSRDQDDVTVALGWFVRIDKIRRPVLIWRASDNPKSWREISGIIDVPVASAKQMYERLIDELKEIANNPRPDPEIDRLRDRNRSVWP